MPSRLATRRPLFSSSADTELQIPHHRRGVAARKGGDERRPFHGDAERLFQRAVEDRLPGAVLEVDDQDRDRRTSRAARRRPRRGCARHHVAAMRATPRTTMRGEALPCREEPRRNACPALLVERFQIREHFRGRRVARGRSGLETLRDDAVERGRDVRLQRLERRRALLEPLNEAGESAFGAIARPSAGDQLVEDQAERIDVGPLVGRLAARLFRRHVVERANQRAGHRIDGRARGRPRDAEVHQQRMVLRIDHDVRRFQIAMDDAGFVRGGEAGGDLTGEQQHARQRQPRFALQQGRQVGALHVLHRQIERALDFAQVVDADHVGMGHLPRQLQLTLEAILELPELGARGGGVDANQLERDGGAERFVPGLVDRGHAAGPEQPDDGVAGPELLAGRQRRSAAADPRQSVPRSRVRQAGKRGVQAWRGCRGLGRDWQRRWARESPPTSRPARGERTWRPGPVVPRSARRRYACDRRHICLTRVTMSRRSGRRSWSRSSGDYIHG